MSTNADHPTQTPAPSVSGKISAGQAFGKYRIVRGVAVGGMAQVFLASRDGPDGFAKPYVIKRILPEYARDDRFIKLFVNEAKVAAMLDHPNIVHVFDFEIENGDYYLVMEYIPGASLSSITRANQKRGVPLGAQVAVEIGAAVADALSYAHDMRLADGRPLDLVHRDISPGNVIVSHDGAVKLADFGVVKTSMTATVVGVVNGKWAYMSPEEICGQPVDRRSDLFSLGILLHEIITGVSLFRGSSAADTASRVMGAKVRHPKALVPDLDPRVDQIVMKLLERDVDARYQTAGELAADLHALRASPMFSAGASHLRGLIRALFPDRTSTPVLGTSMATARLSPVEGHASVGPLESNGSHAAQDDARHAGTKGLSDESDVVFDHPPASRTEGGVSRTLILAIVAACLAGSVAFWLLLF
jgi:serine/threonine protein kinase